MNGSPDIVESDHQAAGQTRKHIRVSMLFLFGRFISISLNLTVQVLTVRYLTKEHYGAFAYALTLVAIATIVTQFGMGTTIARFVPIYHEQRDYQKLTGVLFLAFASTVGIGLAIVIFVFGWQGLINESLRSDPLATSLLLVLIALAPVDAMDGVLSSLLAAFGRTRALFFRRYILTPCLKLAAVLVVITVQGNVHMLAVGYLLGGFLSIVVYGSYFSRILHQERLLQRISLKGLKAQAKIIYGFNMFNLGSEVSRLFRGDLLVIVLLGYFYNTVSVAEFRVVLPISLLNLIVLQNFALFFVPTAARMLAQGKKHMIVDLHWRNAIWVTVLSLPVFLITYSMADQITVLLYGTRYAGSSDLLAVLAFGCFFRAAFGTNEYTLRVLDKVRYIAAGDVVSTIFALILNVVLVSKYGAIGGAFGITATIIVRTVWNQVGLWITIGIDATHFRNAKVYLLAGASVVVFLVIQKLVSPPIYVGILISGALSLAVMIACRNLLQLGETFPELQRAAVFRRLLGKGTVLDTQNSKDQP